MLIALVTVTVFVLATMTYVYLYRGQERYEKVSEYLRKGWPVFTPLNVMLYMFTQKRAQEPIMDQHKFPELDVIPDNWETIRGEVQALYDQGYFDQTKSELSGAYYDVGFRTFYKYGWSKFYLTWYGYTHESAKKLCPKTVEIVKKSAIVNGAMFSMLPPGGKLTRHLDPIACSLRYHLGLATPNSDDAFIIVDGHKHSWRDGQGFLFDETYIHFAENNSDKPRLILMCDVDRPCSFPGRVVNFFYKMIASLTVVPNLEGDKKGLVNSIFSKLSPILQKSKRLKETNRGAYLLLKYTVNTVLIVVILSVFAAVMYGVSKLF